MTTYEITTMDRSWYTGLARAAAEVACSWQRRGLEPAAWVIASGQVTQVDITTVSATAHALAATARELQRTGIVLRAAAAARYLDEGTPSDWLCHGIGDDGLSTPLPPDHDFRGYTENYYPLYGELCT